MMNVGIYFVEECENGIKVLFFEFVFIEIKINGIKLVCMIWWYYRGCVYDRDWSLLFVL